MDIIPIPQEVVEKTVRTTKIRVIRQIRGKITQKTNSHDDKILQRTCLKMSEYVLGNGNFKAEATDSLIDDMHRSIICLQKRKQKMRKEDKRRY